VDGLEAIDDYVEVGAEPIEKVFSGDWFDLTQTIVNMNSGSETGATVRYLSVTLRGDGDNPFGDDTC